MTPLFKHQPLIDEDPRWGVNPWRRRENAAMASFATSLDGRCSHKTLDAMQHGDRVRFHCWMLEPVFFAVQSVLGIWFSSECAVASCFSEVRSQRPPDIKVWNGGAL